MRMAVADRYWAWWHICLMVVKKENGVINNSDVLSKCSVPVNVVFKYLVCGVVILAALAMSGSAIVAQSGNIATKDDKSTAAVAAANKSLGGKKADAIKSVILTGNGKGSIFQSAVNDFSTMNKVGEQSYEFEIRILFPGSFIKITRFPDRDRIRHYGILNGEIIDVSTTSQNKVLSRSGSAEDALKISSEWDRLLAGMIMKIGNMPLTIHVDASDNFIAENKDGLLGTMIFDAKDKWPAKIDYKVKTQTPVISKNPDGSMNLTGFKPEEKSAHIQFANRFPADGVMFPKTIKIIVPGMVDETMTIDDVKINPNLSRKDFDIPAEIAK
jgi:hypothetical protein